MPDWWGIISVEQADGTEASRGGSLDFYLLRACEPNPKRQMMKMKQKLRLLWRVELAHIQERNGMPKYKEKSKDFVLDKIVERIPDRIAEEVLQRQMCEELFQRDYTTIQDVIADYKEKVNHR